MSREMSVDAQLKLRQLYDEGVNKAQACRITGFAEATVYRYYTKWNALKSTTTFDLEHLSDEVQRELEIQARMRCMSVYQFVFRVLNVVVEDNLAKVILDISEEHPVKKRLKC